MCLFWDFDGTLGKRKNENFSSWSFAILEAIKQRFSDTKIELDDVRPMTRQGFPWHEPEKEHTHLHTPDLWWEHIRKLFIQIYLALDFTKEQGIELAHLAQSIYLDFKGWELFDDTIPALTNLQSKGWKHVIISNHVPELRSIVSHLGLDSLVSDIFNSAEIGYEKPNSEIYKRAILKHGNSKTHWMIGDNVIADVIGAEENGIQSILIRNRDKRAKHQFDDLYELQEFLKENSK